MQFSIFFAVTLSTFIRTLTRILDSSWVKLDVNYFRNNELQIPHLLGNTADSRDLFPRG
jgi:hypothetical protein